MYTHVVMMGWKMPTASEVTGARDPVSGWALPPVQAPLPQGMTFGNVSNADMQNRLTRLAIVVDAAYQRYINQWAPNNPPESAGQQVLKVFTIPEFFFRPPKGDGSPGGAYSLVELNELLRAIRQLFQEPRFSDWLFICGTALISDMQASGGTDCKIYNYSIVQQGGTNGDAHYVYKQRTSGIDGVLFQEEPDMILAKASRSEKIDTARVMPPWKLGLEICLDHGLNVLKSVVQTWGIPNGTVTLQVVVSAGMTLLEQSFTVPVNGYVFLNDGMNSSIQHPNIELVQVTQPDGTHNTIQSIEEIDFSTTEGDAFKPAAFPLPQGAVAMGPQSLMIYPCMSY